MLSDSEAKDFLMKMILTGNIKYDNGHLLLMGRKGLLLNSRVLIAVIGYLMKYDKEALIKAGEESIKPILMDYKERMVSKEKFLELVSNILKTSGLGDFEFRFQKDGVIIQSRNSTIPQTYIEMFGKSDEPVCYFSIGAFKAAISFIEGKNYNCKEVSCIAKGDEMCTFILNEQI
ncbi:MAG: 4-vinyl reductase [Candidatus Parvarchaeota archaeon]|nr:4-vinyl reductase [Candidatus Rehaiarchaeum fermentans]